MSEMKAVRERVLAAIADAPETGDTDFDEFATGSLVAAFNRLAPNLTLEPRTDQ